MSTYVGPLYFSGSDAVAAVPVADGTVSNLLTELLASRGCIESPTYTADALVQSGPAILCGYRITTATAVAAIEIRDAVLAATGTVKRTIASGTTVQDVEFVQPRMMLTGIFLDFAPGATGAISILYIA